MLGLCWNCSSLPKDGSNIPRFFKRKWVLTILMNTDLISLQREAFHMMDICFQTKLFGFLFVTYKINIRYQHKYATKKRLIHLYIICVTEVS